MLKIWGRTTSSNVQKVLWCCAELGIEYERVDLGGPFGGNRDPEYLAMNPNGRVPTIQDDGLILWELNTICRYLADDTSWRAVVSERSRSPRECRALDGLAARHLRAADGSPARHADPGQTRTARSGSDRGSTPAGAGCVDDRRGRARRPPLSSGTGADARRDRLGNHGLPLARISDRAAAIEEPQNLVRAHAGASWLQNSH